VINLGFSRKGRGGPDGPYGRGLRYFGLRPDGDGTLWEVGGGFGFGVNAQMRFE